MAKKLTKKAVGTGTGRIRYVRKVTLIRLTRDATAGTFGFTAFDAANKLIAVGDGYRRRYAAKRGAARRFPGARIQVKFA